MTEKSHSLGAIHETLSQDLDSLENMISVFTVIFELDLVARAKRVQSQLIKATEDYFEETWDATEVITSSLDLTFSELDYETSGFGKAVVEFQKSMSEFEGIYKRFVLPHL
jgi:hypothetical protein